ncbi:hypothetical protein NUM_49030 [Actinocatenispora comari]|jgi:hypothetical protein|uniref:Uncharacterized protein n=1 Tax=Actinocatenispora comari TaxID=2807577 RepID=A0A8J4EQB8_9ACTN|nr:hypothetical protein NUM_49030 [Actinocatenispora comari]
MGGTVGVPVAEGRSGRSRILAFTGDLDADPAGTAGSLSAHPVRVRSVTVRRPEIETIRP